VNSDLLPVRDDGTQWHFGIKAGFALDSPTKLIHAVVAMPGNLADKPLSPDLLLNRPDMG
jgi:hypothetical protein